MAGAAKKMRRALETGAAVDDDQRLGARHPDTGRLILDPKRTVPTAEAFVGEFHGHADGTTLRSHHGQFLEWGANHWTEVSDAALRSRIQPWLHRAHALKIDSKGVARIEDFEANPTTVNQALESIRNHTHLADDTAAPCWLDQRPAPAPRELIACRSSILHVPTGRTLPPTPLFFTPAALPFDYNPAAPAPAQWLAFIDDIFEDDQEAKDLLGELFGYVLTGDTSQQKMGMIVGPIRSGKGTIGRVLRELVGTANVANPTTASLAGPFGLQPLLHKSLAIVSDARFSGEATAIVIERLLNISGEDPLTVDRKFLPSVHGRLPVRFIFLTNELPRLKDASTAIASRFLILRLTKSYFDHEDTALTEKLLAELPGILNWSIQGWRRLHARGRFQQPVSAAQALQDLADLASPISAFVRERCITGPGHRVDVDRLYDAWKSWCEADGRSGAGTKQSLGKEIMAAVPGIRSRRGTDQGRFYEGIALRGVTS